MTDATASASALSQLQAHYIQHIQRKRLYSAIMLTIFVLLMVSGFMLADDRNAGGFWAGLHQIFDFPAEVLTEAGEKLANLPG
ncbi:MAG: phosphonate ABC transporter, permease protein PhnE, partial [Lutimaribacter sp.]